MNEHTRPFFIISVYTSRCVESGVRECTANMCVYMSTDARKMLEIVIITVVLPIPTTLCPSIHSNIISNPTPPPLSLCRLTHGTQASDRVNPAPYKYTDCLPLSLSGNGNSERLEVREELYMLVYGLFVLVNPSFCLIYFQGEDRLSYFLTELYNWYTHQLLFVLLHCFSMYLLYFCFLKSP